MPITLPAVNFDQAKTVFGNAVRFVFTPDAGGSPLLFIAKVANFQYKTSTTMRNVPGADGISRPDRENIKEASESFDLEEIEELDDVISKLGGFTPRPKKGTGVIWITDQDDPTGTSVRLKSDAFKCSIRVKDGSTKFGGGEYSKTSIHVQSLKNDQITFTPNATS
ncbi:MAG: hypothetical protein SFV32_12760 [Opitutaceae bacterium]|nr:hypothetical protein [Opitutaceae bacterium]